MTQTEIIRSTEEFVKEKLGNNIAKKEQFSQEWNFKV